MVHDHFDYSTFFDFEGKRNGLGNNSPPLRMLRVFKKKFTLFKTEETYS